MLQNFSYHTHSTWSDGCNTLREMLDRAVSLGWKEIGFSDHLIVHKDMKKSPSWLRMQKEKAPQRLCAHGAYAFLEIIAQLKNLRHISPNCLSWRRNTR